MATVTIEVSDSLAALLKTPRAQARAEIILASYFPETDAPEYDPDVRALLVESMNAFESGERGEDMETFFDQLIQTYSNPAKPVAPASPTR